LRRANGFVTERTASSLTREEFDELWALLERVTGALTNLLKSLDGKGQRAQR